MPIVIGAGVPRRPLLRVAVLAAGWAAFRDRAPLLSLFSAPARGPSALRAFTIAALGTLLANTTKPYDVPDARMYCALLYTNVAGLQDEVDRYIRKPANTAYLDSLTGGNCFVMAIEPRSKRTRKGTRPYSPSDVLRLAANFGVREAGLPACVFFYDWTRKSADDVTRVPLRPMFDRVAEADRPERMTRVFEELFVAVRQVAHHPDAGKRKREFEKLVKHVRKEFVARRRSRLERAGPVLRFVETTAAVLAVVLPGTGLDRWFHHTSTPGGTPYYQVAPPPSGQQQPPV